MISVASGLLLWSLIAAIGFGIAQWRQRVFVEAKLAEVLELLDSSMVLTDSLVAHIQAAATLEQETRPTEIISRPSDRIH